MMTLLLVDDHELFRAGLAQLIEEIQPGVEILHAGSCAEGLDIAQSRALNLIFLDLGLPDGNGLEALAAVKSVRPSVPVVVITGAADRTTVERALALHATGLVLKSLSRSAMIAAIAPVLAGGASVPESVFADSASSWQTPGQGKAMLAVSDYRTLGLSQRQFEVLRLLVQGHPNKIIARTLDISLPGVKKHVSDLLAHFRVMSRSQLIVRIAERRILLGAPVLSEPELDLTDRAQ